MKGSCLCGSIGFEIDADALSAYQCHCTLCKKKVAVHQTQRHLLSNQVSDLLKAVT